MFQTIIKRGHQFKYHYFFLDMNACNIVGHHVDFEVIKQFQKLDSRYCTEKFQKLEKRLITRDIPTIRKPKTVRKVETKTFITPLEY